MNPSLLAPAVSVGLFLAILLCLEVGYRVGIHAQRHGEVRGLGAMQGAIFGLLGLLLGFAFAGAASRLDVRRQLIVQEANAIGTAYLRLDLVPPLDQPELRQLFRDYTEARYRVYEPGRTDLETGGGFLARAAQLQQQIWTRAVAAGRDDTTQNTTRVLLPAVNEMIDVTTTRTVAARTHLPWLVLGLLAGVAILSAVIAGYSTSRRKRRSLLHDVLFALAVATTIYVVLDVDNPRAGVIRLEPTDNLLRELHDSMGR